MPEDEKIDYEIKDSGERTEFESGAVRDLRGGKGRFDLVPWAVIRALAIHFEKGAGKYGDRNWERGIPLSKFLDSATRHLAQLMDGHEDGENHAISALWNMACFYATKLWIQEGKLPESLDDMKTKMTIPNPYAKQKPVKKPQ